MLIGTGQVDSGSAWWHGLDQDFKWGKLVIDVHRRYMESPIQVELMNFFVSFKNRLDCSVGEVIDCCESDLSAQCEKEQYLVHEEDIRCQCHVTMEFEKVIGYLAKVLCHMSGFRACGLSSEGCDIFSPDLVGCDDVVDSYWAVLDLVALDDSFEVLH